MEWLTASQAAGASGRSLYTVRRWLREDRIPGAIYSGEEGEGRYYIPVDQARRDRGEWPFTVGPSLQTGRAFMRYAPRKREEVTNDNTEG